MKQKKIIAISAAIFLMFIACDDGGEVPEQKDDLLAGQYNNYLEEFETQVEKYNNLVGQFNAQVKKYNNLAEKFNTQTRRNTDSDRSIQTATLKLKELDEAVAEYKTAIEEAYQSIEANQCTDARSTIMDVVKPKLDVIATKANVLTQDTLETALIKMSFDLSSYKSKFRDSTRDNILQTQTRISSGLIGIKSFSLSAHNQLIDEFNENCVDNKIGSTGLPDHGISADSVVTVDGEGRREVISRDELKTRYRGTYDESAYNHFSSIATGSGGFLGFSPTPELFSETVEIVLQSIIDKAGSQTDVAIALDTTSSMSDDINNVKNNMDHLLKKLKERASSIGLRLSLLLYRDQGDEYIVRVVNDFTDDIDSINTAIQSITVAGGGNHPEAVVDVLDTAMKDLSWRATSSRSILLIGDAPGHPSSYSGLSTEALINNYKEAGLGIIVYPILVSK